jgi:hypothetical protein
LEPALEAIAFMPAVQLSVFGGPKTIPCCGCMMIPFPIAATVPAGITASVMVEEGLKT